MELADTWTCSCGAENTGDVFTATCWKCGISWGKKPSIEEPKHGVGCRYWNTGCEGDCDCRNPVRNQTSTTRRHMTTTNWCDCSCGCDEETEPGHRICPGCKEGECISNLTPPTNPMVHRAYGMPMDRELEELQHKIDSEEGNSV